MEPTAVKDGTAAAEPGGDAVAEAEVLLAEADLEEGLASNLEKDDAVKRSPWQTSSPRMARKKAPPPPAP